MTDIIRESLADLVEQLSILDAALEAAGDLDGMVAERLLDEIDAIGRKLTRCQLALRRAQGQKPARGTRPAPQRQEYQCWELVVYADAGMPETKVVRAFDRIFCVGLQHFGLRLSTATLKAERWAGKLVGA